MSELNTMSKLDKTSIANLLLLQDKDKLMKSKYKIISNQLVANDEDSFDTVYSYKELEYPVYFTFHQIMNHVRYSYNTKYFNYSKKALLKMLLNVIDNLSDVYSEKDEIDESFENLLEDLENKVMVLKHHYYYGYCYYIPSIVKDWLNNTCIIMLETGKIICEEYINTMKNPGYYEQDTESDDGSDKHNTGSETESGSDDKEEKETKDDETGDEKDDETGEVNPNLIYKGDESRNADEGVDEDGGDEESSDSDSTNKEKDV